MDLFNFKNPMGGSESQSPSSSISGVFMLVLTLSIAVGLGILIVSAVFTGMGTSSVDYDERFSFDDTSVDQTVTISDTPDMSTFRVYENLGDGWVRVNDDYVSVSGTSVTVDSDGL